MNEKQAIFNAEAERWSSKIGSLTPVMDYVQAVHEVAGDLKEMGLDVTLDVRQGSFGCPRNIIKPNIRVDANATLMMDGLPVILTVEADGPSHSLRLYLGGTRMMDFTLVNGQSGWEQQYSSGTDPRKDMLQTLGRIKAEQDLFNKFDIVETDNETDNTATEKRISVGAPLKLKTPAAVA